MASTDFIIRKALPEDALQIADVHIKCWRTTYSGVVSDEFLDGMNLEARANSWVRIIEASSSNVLVADIQGVVVGFASSGKSRENSDYQAELYAIYILEEHQRKNIGRRLLEDSSAWLMECGHSSMVVWILAENPSRRFYESLGGIEVNTKDLPIGKQSLKAVAYGWKDISNIARTA